MAMHEAIGHELADGVMQVVDLGKVARVARQRSDHLVDCEMGGMLVEEQVKHRALTALLDAQDNGQT